MGALCDNTSIFILSFILILFSLISISSARETKCLPSKNEKWNAKKQKCVQCPDCGSGQFRNLTEPYKRRKGEHGAERCTKCRPCPVGTYSSIGYGECSGCRMNCTELKRETSEPCTRHHDAKCGSCLNGYYDMYKNTLFPCAPASPRLLPSRKKSVKVQSKKVVVDKTAQDVEDNVKKSIEPDTVETQHQKSSSLKERDHTSLDLVSIAVYCLAGIVLATLLIGLAVKVRNYRGSNRGILNTRLQNGNGQYDSVPGQDLSNDNDIEMDTFAQSDQNDAALYYPSNETHFPMTLPRRDTHAVSITLARPELSQQGQSNQLDGLNVMVTRLNSCLEQSKDVCKCREINKCQCSTLEFTDDIVIEKADKYVLEVAENICHYPITLFIELGLQSNDIYQENDTRERDPEKISQKTFVINLLHKWIEKESTPTTLRQLSLALCKADFHSINEKLYKLSISNDTLS